MQSSLDIAAIYFSEDDTAHQGVSCAKGDKLLVCADLHTAETVCHYTVSDTTLTTVSQIQENKVKNDNPTRKQKRTKFYINVSLLNTK